MTPPDATLRRVRVLGIRIRIEDIAERASKDFCQPNRFGSHRDRIRARLRFVLCHVGAGYVEEAAKRVKIAAYVYARTSKVLHSHNDMIYVSSPVIAEWEAETDRLEGLMERWGR